MTTCKETEYQHNYHFHPNMKILGMQENCILNIFILGPSHPQRPRGR